MIYFIDNLDLMDDSELIKLGEAFSAEAKVGKFDVDAFKKSMEIPLLRGSAGLWIAENDDSELIGILGGMRTPLFFNTSVVAIEMFWYVHPQHRGGTVGFRLLEEFERWARGSGVDAIHLAYIEGVHDEKMKGFYERRGYTKLETIYRKQLWQ